MDRNALVFLVALFAFVPPAYPRTLVVAKTGAAYASVQSGLNAAVAGDTVSVKAGAYNEGVSFGKSGSAEAGYITLLAEPGAILDGAGLNIEALVSIASKSYVRVQGWEARGLSGSGTPTGIAISGAGSHLEILGNKVHHIENPDGNAHGISAYGNASAPLAHLLVEGNEIHDCKLGQSESLALNGNVSDFVVSDNLVHDNDNIGIDFIGFEGTGPAGQDQARNGICRGNRVYNVSSLKNPTYGGDRSADGIYVDGGRDIVIEGNTVDNCDIAFEIASEHGGKSTSNIIIRNNFASRSFQGNIMAGGYSAAKGVADSIGILGNTTYSGNAGEVVLQNNCKNVLLENNIFYAASGKAYLVNGGSGNTAITVDRNLYFGASGTSAGAWNDAHGVFSNPGLQNPPANLHLQAGSPAVDAGAALDPLSAGAYDIDGDAPIQGVGPDIGADETGGAVSLQGMVPLKRPGHRFDRLRDGLGRRVSRPESRGVRPFGMPAAGSPDCRIDAAGSH